MNKFKINEIGEVITGKTPRTDIKDNYGDDYLFISPTELHQNFLIESSEKKISKKGFESIKSNTISGLSILVGCIGWDMGNVALVDQTCATNQQINSITNIKKDFNPYYIYYWLKGKKKFLFQIANVTRTPILNKSTFSDIEIDIPSKIKQDKVVKLLQDIDDKIKNNTKINNNLEELMKTLYQRWFIEFEFPNKDGKSYKSNGGKFVYNNDLKQNIPETWKVENCFKNKLYEIIKPGLENFERKNYLATGNVNENVITDGEWITYDNRESRANMQPIKNSIWFAKMKNSVKHLTLPENSEWFINKYVLSTGFLGIKCKENSLSYLHCFIYSNYFEKVKDMLAHGATQEAINNEDLKAIKLLIPNNEILEKFENETKSIIQKQLEIEHENQRLIELKEFLLPMLMNGQINVDDIEI